MKRVLTLLVALVPTVAMAAGVSVNINGRLVTFTDVPQDAWFATYVRTAAESGIVNGYSDSSGNLTGRFGPGDPITVEQALKVAIEGAGYNVNATPLLPGLTGSRWSDKYFSLAVNEHFSFVDRNEVLSALPATRAEVAQIVVDAFRVKTEVSVAAKFGDVKTNTQYALAIEALARDGVVSGDTNAAGQLLWRYRPAEKINRAEAVKIAMRARQVYGQPGNGQGSQANASAPATQVHTVVVKYTDNGFVPSTVTVSPHTLVIFENGSRANFWVASNPHPTHTDLPGFDAKQNISAGEQYSFTFDTVGHWGYHNHLNPSEQGTVIVQ